MSMRFQQSTIGLWRAENNRLHIVTDWHANKLEAWLAYCALVLSYILVGDAGE